MGPELYVMVVEDNAGDAHLVCRSLWDNPSVGRVVVARDGAEALALLEADVLTPNLALVDLQMPRIGGFEFLARLRLIPKQIDMPVVFLTHSDLGLDILKYMDTSASMYVIKPDTFAELEIRIDQIIKRTISGAWSA